MECAFRNTRIYKFNGDFEAVFCNRAWRISKGDQEEVERMPRGKSENVIENRMKTIQKAKSKVRRLVKTYNLNRLVTLTFKDNIQDVKEADHSFRKYMKRLLRRYPELKYVAAREFQERGAVHYHQAINCYIDQEVLAEVWGEGFVWIEKKQGDQTKMANYISKYITKYAFNEKIKKYNLYLRSHDMELDYEDYIFDDYKDCIRYLKERYPETIDKKVELEFKDEEIRWIG